MANIIRILCFSFIFMIQIHTALANILYKGYVTRSKTGYQIKDEYSNKIYNLLAHSKSIWIQIQTLESGDYISGSAYNETTKELLVTSIDFAGLVRLFGMWKSHNHVVQFEDFNNVNFWNFEANKFWGPFHYNYTITPGEDGQWRILFVDDDKALMASITCMKKKHLTLTFYDNNTGAITKIYELERP